MNNAWLFFAAIIGALAWIFKAKTDVNKLQDQLAEKRAKEVLQSDLDKVKEAANNVKEEERNYEEAKANYKRDHPDDTSN